jgi:hypothetical protein
MLNRAFADGVNLKATNAFNTTMSSSPNRTIVSAIDGNALTNAINIAVLNTTDVLVEVVAAHILNGTFSDEIKITAANALQKIVSMAMAGLTSA